MVQYQTTFELKIDYIVELKDKLITAKNNQILEEEVNIMIKDIRNFLINRDNYKTNQQYLGFKALFCGFVIKSWFGTNFSSDKYAECKKYYLI